MNLPRTASKHSSRLCLTALTLVLVIQGICETTAAPAPSMKALRQAAADRRRRIILNNDGGEPIRQMTRPSAQDMLELYTTRLAGTQVDSLFYCTGPSGLGVFSHFTKIGQVFTSREGSYSNNQMSALLAKGIDPLRVNLAFARSNGMEFFWSMRMNDTHDNDRTEYGPIRFRFNKMKQEHPEYLIGSAKKPTKYGTWTAVNYAVPEIRDLVFRYIEEVCRNYDVDGIEMDFFRHPVFFKSTGRGLPATADERAAMTGLMKRIRVMADEVGRSRGRPILIAMRVPDSVEYCRAIGLELDDWLANDLLDLLMVSSYFKLNDWDYSVALARRYGVKVYPSLDESRVRDETARTMRRTALAFRGRAANIWAYGADGVYAFNFSDSSDSLPMELGDPRVLAKLDKDYFGSVRGRMNAAGGNLPYEKYQTIETLNPGNPKTVAPGKTAEARIIVGEDWRLAGPVNLKLRLQFKKAVTPQLAQVTCNGSPLRLLGTKETWLEYEATPSIVRRLANQIQVKLAEEAPPAVWTDLMLEVRHSTDSRKP
jgi:hypothetical protein